MKKNVGSTDRLIRLLLTVVFGVLYYSGIVTGFWGIVVLVLGVVMLLTSLAGVCPLYSLVGVNTCKQEEVA